MNIEKVVAVVVILIVLSGCAGPTAYRTATLGSGSGTIQESNEQEIGGNTTTNQKSSGDVITWKDSNKSWFEKPVDPVRLATAYSIKKRADTEEMATKMTLEGKAVKSISKYTFLAQNLSGKKIYVSHPEKGYDIEIDPKEGYYFMNLSYLPDRIVFKNDQAKVVLQVPVDSEKIKTKKVFFGREVDFKIVITKL